MSWQMYAPVIVHTYTVIIILLCVRVFIRLPQRNKAGDIQTFNRIQPCRIELTKTDTFSRDAQPCAFPCSWSHGQSSASDALVVFISIFILFFFFNSVSKTKKLRMSVQANRVSCSNAASDLAVTNHCALCGTGTACTYVARKRKNLTDAPNLRAAAG